MADFGNFLAMIAHTGIHILVDCRKRLIMASKLPVPPSEDALIEPDRMLDGINALQKPGRNTSALRAMFGAIDAGASAIEADEKKLKRTLQQRNPKAPQAAPAL